jgi:hypothetical protein
MSLSQGHFVELYSGVGLFRVPIHRRGQSHFHYVSVSSKSQTEFDVPIELGKTESLLLPRITRPTYRKAERVCPWQARILTLRKFAASSSLA